MDGRAKGKGCASRGLGLITIIRIGPILTSGSIKRIGRVASQVLVRQFRFRSKYLRSRIIANSLVGTGGMLIQDVCDCQFQRGVDIDIFGELEKEVLQRIFLLCDSIHHLKYRPRIPFCFGGRAIDFLI